jgi:hypothetical protein
MEIISRRRRCQPAAKHPFDPALFAREIPCSRHALPLSWWAQISRPAAKGTAMSSKSAFRSVIVLIFVLGIVGSAFTQMPNAYGPPVTLETAKKVAAPALAEAAKNN